MIESRLSASSGHQYCEPGPSIHRNTRIAIRIVYQVTTKWYGSPPLTLHVQIELESLC